MIVSIVVRCYGNLAFYPHSDGVNGVIGSSFAPSSSSAQGLQ
ncbi:hypothetical protein CAter282_1790 [Collimonas arenae]|uniref:Uncharacterized protein n=1 Tax=Collimonas arenae TaxID=279058 RepID=A0A127PPI4_9BURK|nr:hypothetical protein [Collimonas arenae]AMO99668.1 hypothetical protein CAter10_1929 [Collimonas arenae]AMP09566.1 hypothetical protein CAter282_1790 [Collimonas arenae]